MIQPENPVVNAPGEKIIISKIKVSQIQINHDEMFVLDTDGNVWRNLSGMKFMKPTWGKIELPERTEVEYNTEDMKPDPDLISYTHRF